MTFSPKYALFFTGGLLLIGGAFLFWSYCYEPLYRVFANRLVKEQRAENVKRDFVADLPAQRAQAPVGGKNNHQNLAAIGAQHLIAAYPDHIVSIEGNVLIWKDGTTMPYDDGVRKKTFEQVLIKPSLKDQMATHYSKGSVYPRTKNWDPGRARYQPFFTKMYGATEKDVRARLKPVIWLRNSLRLPLLMTSVNGVDKKLQAVSDELDALPGELRKHVNRNVSTFKWRKIAGTSRLSTHSFGIAIDVNSDGSQYWLWDDVRGKEMRAPNHQLPIEIVEIFEKHGFIWGGKWYHYDTMHFEYRPELLIGG